MDAKKFLQDMLSEGKSLWDQGLDAADKGTTYAAEQLGAAEGDPNHELYKKVTGGAALAGALALGLGTKSGGALMRLGGLAALGTMAYRAYQRGQDGREDAVAVGPIEAAAGPDADRRARALLRAMIAGARADGHIDDSERTMIEQRLAALGEDAQAFFMAELMKPLDAAEIAKEAESPQQARELYAMAALVCRTDHLGERRFLRELAEALGLPAGVAREIERELGEA